MRFKKIASLALLMVSAAFSGHAEEPHDTIRTSLVFIRAIGLSIVPGQTGAQVESSGTGFFVSDDGMILTNYHLLDQLGEVHPKSIRFEIAIGETSANKRPAATVNGSEILDLLVLKTPPSLEAFSPVELGSAYHHPEGAEIFTSGFPESSYRKKEGAIEARDAPGGVLWSTSFQIKGGQSGSPVYDDEGRVIGIIKGDDLTESYMIPIEFADSLITAVRLRDLQATISELEKQIAWLEIHSGKHLLTEDKLEIKDGEDVSSRLTSVEGHIDSVASNFLWSGEINPQTGDLHIRYRKLVGGDKQHDAIGLLVNGTFHMMVNDIDTGKPRLDRTPPKSLLIVDDPEDLIERTHLSTDGLIGTFSIKNFKSEILKRLTDVDIMSVGKGVNKLPRVRISVIIPDPKQDGELISVAKFNLTCEIRECLNL